MSHLTDMGETYLQHWRFALLFSIRLLLAGVFLFIHAWIPDLFIHYTSTELNDMNEIMKKRLQRDLGGTSSE